MIDLIWLVPLLPLIGFLLIGLGRNMLSKAIIGFVGCTTVLVSFIISIGVFLELNSSAVKSFTIPLFDWINAGALSIPFSFFNRPVKQYNAVDCNRNRFFDTRLFYGLYAS